MTSEIGRRVGINNWSKLLMDSILKHCRHTGRGCWKLGKIAEEIILKIFKNVFFLIFFFIFRFWDSSSSNQITEIPTYAKNNTQIEKKLTVEKLKGRKNVKLRAWDEVATSWFPELSIETAFLQGPIFLRPYTLKACFTTIGYF